MDVVKLVAERRARWPAAAGRRPAGGGGSQLHVSENVICLALTTYLLVGSTY
jgi:hypothetical protein